MNGDAVEEAEDDAVWRWPGMAGAVLALVSTGYAHVTAGGAVDPMRNPVGDYVLLDAGAWAMTAGTIALALGSVWTAYGLARVDPARSAAARVLFLAAALGLLLTAAFPADSAPGVASIGGEIHRWSAAVVFTALPCAGWMLGRRFGKRSLRVVSVLSVALLATFLAVHPGSAISNLMDGTDYYGLVERLLLLTDMTLVFLAARGLNGRTGEGARLPFQPRPGTGAAVPAPRAPASAP